MRRFVESEPEILRYILATIPSLPDARDILQNTAVALWKKMGDYDPEVPFTPWACRFASLEIRAFLRKEKRHRRWLDEDVANQLQLHQLQQQAAKQPGDMLNRLRDCLRRLPDLQRRILTQYYFEEEGVEGIAATTNRSVEAIYKVLQRSRVALHHCLQLRMKEGLK